MISRLTAALLFGVASLAAQQIAMDEASASAGETVTVSVWLASPSAKLAGLQFDVNFDERVGVITTSEGTQATKAAKQVKSATTAAGHLRVLIIGLNRDSINDGEVAKLQIKLDPKASGVYTLTVKEAQGTTPDGKPVPLRSLNGQLKVRSTGR